jgi:signal transduction histidine kinase
MSDNSSVSVEKEQAAVPERLVRAADAARRALERELHEGVQQHLVALALSVQLARQAADSDPDAVKSLLDDMRRDVQQANEDAVLLAQRIYPATLELGGLAALLRAAAVSAGVSATVDVEAESRYPSEIGMTLYLCWLAFLARGHDGGPVMIEVRRSKTGVVFELGGNVTADADLAALQDRVEALGGRLSIEPGARLSGSLPFER